MSPEALGGGCGEYWYKIFGLVICSEFELPEASAPLLALERVADFVEIKRGSAPASLAGGRKLADWIEVAADECLYWVEGVCRMHVVAGRLIVIDRFPGVPDSDVRAFLFGSGLGTIIHQRRLVPLHVSAVQSPTGTIAFTGPSGAGKSTIAAALAKFHDWPIICDDMAVLDPADKEPVLHVGVRRKKLWRDAVEALGLGDREMERDVSRLDKFHLSIERLTGSVAPPIRHLFELTWGEEISIQEMAPARRFALVMNAIYRPYLTPIFGNLSVARKIAVLLAQHIRGFELARPQFLSDLNAVAGAVVRNCQQHAEA